jgi:hypothetical protein
MKAQTNEQSWNNHGSFDSVALATFAQDDSI